MRIAYAEPHTNRTTHADIHYALQHSVTVTEPVLTKTQAFWAVF